MVILRDVQKSATFITYFFVRLRSDGVELDAIHIATDLTGIITTLEILHNIEGDCAFNAAGELLHCTAWESEEAAQASSEWSRHYPLRVGKSTAGVVEGLRIFSNLERSVGDTYLRYILKNFIRFEGNVIFDAELYRLIPAEPPPTDATATITESTTEPQSRQHDSKRLIFALIIIVPILSGIFLFLYNRPPERPPMSFEMKSLSETPLLPVLTMLSAGYESVLSQYTSENKRELEAFATEAAPVRFENKQQFLDALYPLDRQIQLSTFHDKIIKSGDFSDLKKAELLRALLSENWMRLITHRGDSVIPSAFESLRNQLDNAALLTYLLYLHRQYPHTALSIEARLIFFEMIQTQKRVATFVFYASEVQEVCGQKRIAWHKYPHEATVVCNTVTRYQSLTRIPEAELSQKFDTFSQTVLDSLQRETLNYRQAEIACLKAALKIETAADAVEILEGLRLWRSITPGIADDFNHPDFYRGFSNLLNKHAKEISTLNDIARDERFLRKLLSDADILRATIARRTRDLSLIKSLYNESRAASSSEAIQKAMKRAEKFGKKTP